MFNSAEKEMTANDGRKKQKAQKLQDCCKNSGGFDRIGSGGMLYNPIDEKKRCGFDYRNKGT